MLLPTLTVTKEEALEQLRLYRRASKTIVLTREEQRMMGAYKAIADGHDVIDLHRAIALGGHDVHEGAERPVTLPRLAVLRATARWAWCDGIGRDGSVSFRTVRSPRTDRQTERVQLVEVFDRDDTRRQLWFGDRVAWRALVPPCPPYLRPTRTLYGEQVPIDLRNYFTMWEAEWQLDRTVPPGDPALLQKLGGTLYKVIAKWDLTPVEQAVLAGREPTAAEIGGRR